MTRTMVLFVFALLAGSIASFAAGAPPHLVANLDHDPALPSLGTSTVGGLLALGNQALLATSYDHNGGLGSETVWEFGLWLTDGTGPGTRLLRSFRHLEYGSLTLLKAEGSLGFFASPKQELWRSDGTAAGTFRVSPDGVVVDGDELVYFGQISGVATLPGRIVLIACTDATGCEPWSSDGTAAGTELLADLAPGPASSFFDRAVTVHGELVFAASTSSASLLVGTDGTPEGTVVVASLAEAWPHDPVSVGATAYFLFDSPPPASTELWRSDGRRALRLRAFPWAVGLTLAHGRLFFTADDGSGARIWTSDGTARGTVPLPRPAADSRAQPAYPSVLGAVRHGVLLSSAAGQLFRTRGTAATTYKLRDCVGECPRYRTSFGPLTDGQRILFLGERGADDATETGLWVSDGSAAGTQLLTVLAEEVDSCCPEFEPFTIGSRLFFQLDTYTWVSDGSAKGTFELTDVFDGTVAGTTTVASNPAYSWSVADWNGEHYLLDEHRLSRIGSSGQAILLTEGLFGSARSLISWQEALYFVAEIQQGTSRGTWLMRSNGTAIGTEPVASVSSVYYGLIPAADRIFFSASDREHGRELWATDGTAAGTALVSDVASGFAHSNPSALTMIGDLLYFSANDGEHGTEPWVSDGTPAGTRLLADLAPGAFPSWPGGFAEAGVNVYFHATDGIVGKELWVLAQEVP